VAIGAEKLYAGSSGPPAENFALLGKIRRGHSYIAIFNSAFLLKLFDISRGFMLK